MNLYATEQKKLREIYCRYGEELWSNPELLERALNESFPGDSNKPFIQAVMSCAEHLGSVDTAEYRKEYRGCFAGSFYFYFPQSAENGEFPEQVCRTCLSAMGMLRNKIPVEDEISKPFEEARVNDDLAELIDHTECGGTLALKAGTYHLTKALVITKPIQISGAGINRTRIMNSTGDSILQFDCAGALKVSGLSLLWQISERTEKSAVSIKNGNLQMEDCALVVKLDRYEIFCVRNESYRKFVASKRVPALLLERAQGSMERCYFGGSAGTA